MFIYWAAMLLLLVLMEGSVRRIVRSRGEATNWLTINIMLKFPPAIAWTQILYPKVMISMFFMRLINWRGICYQVSGPWQIRLLEYRPYKNNNNPTDARASL